MKKPDHQRLEDMRPEYDFASLGAGVRGKHYARYRLSTNIVVLEQDVAQAFPTETAVNEALRGILKTARAVRKTGGLPERSLNGVSKQRRRS